MRCSATENTTYPTRDQPSARASLPNILTASIAKCQLRRDAGRAIRLGCIPAWKRWQAKDGAAPDPGPKGTGRLLGDPASGCLGSAVSRGTRAVDGLRFSGLMQQVQCDCGPETASALAEADVFASTLCRSRLLRSGISGCASPSIAPGATECCPYPHPLVFPLLRLALPC